MKTISTFCKMTAMTLIKEEINDRRVEIFELPSWDGPIQLGVDWSACGTVEPEEAVEFAAKLVRAAEIAANHPINGCKVVYSS